MRSKDKPLVWLHGEIKTPPLSTQARLKAGYLLRVLQSGETVSMPHSRPMPSIGRGCHELRINDETRIWRIFYRIDQDAIVIADIINKKTGKIPDKTIENCRARFARYDDESR